MEIRNVIELSAFSKSLSKKITYLNHEERILIDIEQIAAITPSSEREDLPKKVGLASCNNDEAKEELYTCVLLKCGFSIRVIESVEEVYNKIQEYTILLSSNKNQFYLKCEAKEKWRLCVFARRILQSKKKK
jgi:hypothetical protein